MFINTNVPALNSHRSILSVSGRQAKSAERLSTGMRINRASDDAAGLAISEKMRNQIRGLDQATRNSQDGISLVQTAEGAMEEIHRIMERVRVLTNQAANDVNTQDDRNQILQEIRQILAEVDQIAYNTEFNEQRILNGTGDRLANDISINIIEGIVSAITNNAFIGPGIPLLLVGFPGGTDAFDLMWLFQNSDDVIDAFGTSFEAAQAWIDSRREFAHNVANAFSNGIHNVMGDMAPTTNLFANTTFMDTFDDALSVMLVSLAGVIEFNSTGVESFGDFFADIVVNAFMSTVTWAALRWLEGLVASPRDIDRNFIINHHDQLNLQVQTGANRMQRLDVGIQAMSLRGLSMHAFTERFEEASRMDVTRGGLEFSELLRVVDFAVNRVSAQRANLGAVQNRLEHTINNLGVASENLSAANSRIRDTDMAAEMMRFTQANVLQQAGMSMLAQANMAPNNVLQLLG